MSEINPSFSPWTRMWLQPRATMRFLLQQTPHWYWYLPAFLVGAIGVFQMSSVHPQLQQAPLTQRISTAIMLGGLSGWVAVLLVAFGLGLLGRLWQAKSDVRGLRLAVAWSQLPNVIGFGFWLLEMHWFGAPVAGANHDERLPFVVVHGLLSLYGATLLAMSVAEVQQIPLRRSAVSIALLFLCFMSLAALVIPGAAT